MIVDPETLSIAEQAAARLRELPSNRGKKDDELVRQVLAAAGWRFNRRRDRWVWNDGSEALPTVTLRDAVILAAAARAATPETIERAAVRKDGVVYDVPRPQRHDAAIRKACEARRVVPLGDHEQGFVTSDGRFVGRKEAAKIALEAGQIKQPQRILTSEDVW